MDIQRPCLIKTEQGYYGTPEMTNRRQCYFFLTLPCFNPFIFQIKTVKNAFLVVSGQRALTAHLGVKTLPLQITPKEDSKF